MTEEHISVQTGTEFMKESLYKYGVETIENRALIRLEDGLKPVQRMLLWAARELKTSNFTKSSKICANATGGYHPHGDAAAYTALVNLVNDRYGSFEGMGNWGAIDAEAASPRYTEARISQFFRKISIDQPDLAVVPFVPNYDESKQQPVYLPTTIPYLLLNGTEGIAMVLTARMPSFNLAEVCKATLRYLETQDIDRAIRYIIAPDGAVCTLLSAKAEVVAVIKNGEGTLEYECRHALEERPKGFRLVVSGYTPEFNLPNFLERCGRLQDEELIDVVRNETSAKNGDRIIVDFKDRDVYERKLLKLMRVKISYKMNVLIERDGRLKAELCGVGKLIQEWVIVRRRTLTATIKASQADIGRQIEREKAKQQAVLNLKQIFAALQQKGDFKKHLMDNLGFTIEQAQMIAEMRVEGLRSASAVEIESKIVELEGRVKALEADLGRIDELIGEQIRDVAKWAQKNEPSYLERKTEVRW